MPTFRSLLLSMLTLLIASPAFALSCMPYSARQAFQDASASPDRYIVVRGQVDFNMAHLPTPDMSRQDLIKPDNFFNATFTGLSLTGTGFDARFIRQIQVNVQCYAAWCGGLSSGQEYLMFLKQTSTGYLLETNPCGGFAFENAGEEVFEDMHQCLLGENCTPEHF